MGDAAGKSYTNDSGTRKACATVRDERSPGYGDYYSKG